MCSFWRMSGPLLCSLLTLLLIAFPAHSAKPRDNNGMFIGNGFPSGPHYNLIIHGKDRDTFTCPEDTLEDVYLLPVEGEIEVFDIPKDGTLDDALLKCEAFATEAGVPTTDCYEGTVWGNSIFVPRTEEGDEIKIIMESGAKGPRSRKGESKLKALEATDWCTEPFDDDPATVRFPQDPEGYAVYGRVLGKPSQEDDEPSFTFTADGLVQVSDGNGNDLLLLGVVSNDGTVFVPNPDGEGEDGITLYRWDSTTSGKGAKKAKELTGLFNYSGTVCYLTEQSQEDFCFDPEGAADNRDLCAAFDPDNDAGTTDALCCVNADPDNTDDPLSWDECVMVTEEDFDTWLLDNGGMTKDDYCATLTDDFTLDDGATGGEDVFNWVDPLCKTFSDEWVFNIADFVDVLFGGDTTGAYNVQVRFYPISENPQLMEPAP